MTTKAQGKRPQLELIQYRRATPSRPIEIWQLMLAGIEYASITHDLRPGAAKTWEALHALTGEATEHASLQEAVAFAKAVYENATAAIEAQARLEGDQPPNQSYQN